MSSWTLGIDFGTTSTVAVVADGATSTLVDVEADGSCRIPSAVYLNEEGRFAVGRAAIHQALFHPERFEPTPKRSIGEGEVWLGDETFPVTDVVAAVLEKVGTEARNIAGGSVPGRTVLTHPADWGSTRLEVLKDAAQSAGLGVVELVPEPVAAAIEIGAKTLKPGDHVAVYDFGGGTFDVAVLRRTKDGFEVAGPPGGRDPLGGEHIDTRIIEYLGSGPTGAHPDWPKLLDPPDLEWRRHAADLRTEVRKAKEGLSNQMVWKLWVPGLGRDVQLSRSELEDLIREDVALTIRILVDTVKAAGIEPQDLRGIYLVGGSSRIPAVYAEVWRCTELQPSVQGDPKTVVAQGATSWWPPTKVKVDTSTRPFQSKLAMATRTVFWTSPVYCYGYLTVTTADGEQITVSDEPTPGTLADVVATASDRWESKPDYELIGFEDVEWLGSSGVERQFALVEPTRGRWVERYAVVDGRSFVVAAPDELAQRIETVVRVRSPLDQQRFFQTGVTIGVAEGDRVLERVQLVRVRSNHGVTAESYELDPQWGRAKVETFRSHPGYTPLGQSPGRLLATTQKTWTLGFADGVPGEMHTFWVATDTGRYQTRLWVGQAAGRSYSVAAILPEAEKLGFRLLMAHPTLIGGA